MMSMFWQLYLKQEAWPSAFRAVDVARIEKEPNTKLHNTRLDDACIWLV